MMPCTVYGGDAAVALAVSSPVSDAKTLTSLTASAPAPPAGLTSVIPDADDDCRRPLSPPPELAPPKPAARGVVPPTVKTCPATFTCDDRSRHAILSAVVSSDQPTSTLTRNRPLTFGVSRMTATMSLDGAGCCVGIAPQTIGQKWPIDASLAIASAPTMFALVDS